LAARADPRQQAASGGRLSESLGRQHVPKLRVRRPGTVWRRDLGDHRVRVPRAVPCIRFRVDPAMTSAPRHRAVSHLSRARYAAPGRPGSPGEPPASTPTWHYPPTAPTRPARWSSSPKARPRLPASGGPIVICRGRALPPRRSRNRDPPGGGGLSHHACFEPRSGRRCPGRHRGSAGRPGNQQAPRAGGGVGASDAGGSAGTARQATAGRLAGSGSCWSGGAALRSHAGGPRARRHWTPHAGPEPSGSRAPSARGGR